MELDIVIVSFCRNISPSSGTYYCIGTETFSLKTDSFPLFLRIQILYTLLLIKMQNL